MQARGLRRDRAARRAEKPFLVERAFEDCLERLVLMRRDFDRALLIGCPVADWPKLLGAVARTVEVRDPGAMYAACARGEQLVEDAWLPTAGYFDLVLAVGTLDTVNDLPLALQMLGHALAPGGQLIGAMAGGNTLPELRQAMRAADAVSGGAGAHAHPRIEPSALAALLTEAGFVDPVVDVDRASVAYRSFSKLIDDLRASAATNVLRARPRFVGKAALAAAEQAFAAAGDGDRTIETVETLHFAARRPG